MERFVRFSELHQMYVGVDDDVLRPFYTAAEGDCAITRTPHVLFADEFLYAVLRDRIRDVSLEVAHGIPHPAHNCGLMQPGRSGVCFYGSILGLPVDGHGAVKYVIGNYQWEDNEWQGRWPD